MSNASWASLLRGGAGRLVGVAVALALSLLVVHFIFRPTWRKSLVEAAFSAGPCLAIRAEKALLRSGEDGIDAIFEEARRRWKLPDVRQLERMRLVPSADLHFRPVSFWLLADDGSNMEILTDGLRRTCLGEEVARAPQKGAQLAPVLVCEPVDFGEEVLEFREKLRRRPGEPLRAVIVTLEDDFRRPEVWNEFWRAHCAWQKGMACPEFRAWVSRCNSAASARSHIQETGLELSRVLYLAAVEDVQEKEWEEVRRELQFIIQVFPGSSAAEAAGLLGHGVDSIIEDERTLDLSKRMEDMTAEERKALVAYYLRERRDAFQWGWVGLTDLRMSALHMVALGRGEPSPYEQLWEDDGLPEIDWKAALPVLRELRYDERPTRSVCSPTSEGLRLPDEGHLETWYRCIAIGEKAALMARNLVDGTGMRDLDGDGMPDWIELYYIGSLDEDGSDDHDRDGLTNAEELNGLGTRIDLKDTDGDGSTDKEEMEAGTRPYDRLDRPKRSPWRRRTFCR